jgi:hypothetical protein
MMMAISERKSWQNKYYEEERLQRAELKVSLLETRKNASSLLDFEFLAIDDSCRHENAFFDARYRYRYCYRLETAMASRVTTTRDSL